MTIEKVTTTTESEDKTTTTTTTTDPSVSSNNNEFSNEIVVNLNDVISLDDKNTTTTTSSSTTTASVFDPSIEQDIINANRNDNSSTTGETHIILEPLKKRGRGKQIPQTPPPPPQPKKSNFAKKRSASTKTTDSTANSISQYFRVVIPTELTSITIPSSDDATATSSTTNAETDNALSAPSDSTSTTTTTTSTTTKKTTPSRSKQLRQLQQQQLSQFLIAEPLVRQAGRRQITPTKVYQPHSTITTSSLQSDLDLSPSKKTTPKKKDNEEEDINYGTDEPDDQLQKEPSSTTPPIIIASPILTAKPAAKRGRKTKGSDKDAESGDVREPSKPTTTRGGKTAASGRGGRGGKSTGKLKVEEEVEEILSTSEEESADDSDYKSESDASEEISEEEILSESEPEEPTDDEDENRPFGSRRKRVSLAKKPPPKKAATTPTKRKSTKSSYVPKKKQKCTVIVPMSLEAGDEDEDGSNKQLVVSTPSKELALRETKSNRRLQHPSREPTQSKKHIFVGTELPTIEELDKDDPIQLLKSTAVPDYGLLPKELMNDYLPKDRLTGKIRIGEDADERFSLFQSMIITDYKFKTEFIFYCGGYISAMDWCPIPETIEATGQSQYLAVATHRTILSTHFKRSIYRNKNIIQIWEFPEMTTSSTKPPKLAFAIAHEGDTVWDLKWLPRGGFIQNKETGENIRLGILAAVLGDGSIKVWSIPHPDKHNIDLGINISSSSSNNNDLENNNNSNNNKEVKDGPIIEEMDENNNNNINNINNNVGDDEESKKLLENVKILNIEPFFNQSVNLNRYLSVRGDNKKEREFFGSSLAWSNCTDDTTVQLLVGCTNGQILMYDIGRVSESITSTATPIDEGDLQQQPEQQPPVFTAKDPKEVDSIQFSPIDNNYFVTLHKRKVNIWDKRNQVEPIISYQSQTFVSHTTLLWPRSNQPCVLISDNGDIKTLDLQTLVSLNLRIHEGEILCLDQSKDLASVASCSTDGTVKVYPVLNEIRKYGNHPFYQIENIEHLSEFGITVLSTESVHVDFPPLRQPPPITKTFTQIKQSESLFMPTIHQRITKVKWNKNQNYSGWLSFGGGLGIVRYCIPGHFRLVLATEKGSWSRAIRILNAGDEHYKVAGNNDAFPFYPPSPSNFSWRDQFRYEAAWIEIAKFSNLQLECWKDKGIPFFWTCIGGKRLSASEMNEYHGCTLVCFWLDDNSLISENFEFTMLPYPAPAQLLQTKVL
eukprot:gene3920-4895_t